jgi:hypothetical protein
VIDGKTISSVNETADNINNLSDFIPCPHDLYVIYCKLQVSGRSLF